MNRPHEHAGYIPPVTPRVELEVGERRQDKLDEILILGLDFAGAHITAEEYYGDMESREDGVRRAYRYGEYGVAVEYRDGAIRRTVVDDPELLRRGVKSRTVIEINPKLTINPRTEDGWSAKKMRTSFRTTAYTNGYEINEVVFTGKNGEEMSFVVPPVDSTRENPAPLAVRQDPDNRPFDLQALVPENPVYERAWALYNGLRSLIADNMGVQEPLDAAIRARRKIEAARANAAPTALAAGSAAVVDQQAT